MKKEFYVFISNKDNINLFPNNLPTIFESYLGEYISFETNNWEVGIKELNIDIFSENSFPIPLSICSDICDSSFVHGKRLSVLREIFIDNNTEEEEVNKFKKQIVYDTPLYIPLKSKTINSIKINFINIDREQVLGISGSVYITLHFRKVFW